jgi:hypothetical protein
MKTSATRAVQPKAVQCYDMRAVSLPARLLYAVAAIPVGGAAGFYSSMALLPKLATILPQLNGDGEGFGIFRIALGVGTALAFTLSLLALTLPWRRHRKRRGRGWRIAVSCALVVVSTAGLSVEGYSLIYDLAFALWLAYTLAFTFVRYGVTDDLRRSPRASSQY